MYNDEGTIKSFKNQKFKVKTILKLRNYQVDIFGQISCQRFSELIEEMNFLGILLEGVAVLHVLVDLELGSAVDQVHELVVLLKNG